VQAGKQKVLAFAFASVLVFSFVAIGLPTKKAYADGITQETFSASLGDRQAELLVKVNPPILTDASKNNAYMLLRLYDAKSNQTIKATTFDLEVEKGVGANAENLIRESFYSDSGLLQLKIEPAEGKVLIAGNLEPSTGAYMADPGGVVNVKGPIFLEGGIYHLNIQILGIDFARNFFPPDKIPQFDSWLSVGDVFTQSVDYQGQPYSTTIISYYDKLNNFDFNTEKEQYSWSMPFDWNVTRIKSTNIFVHEEIRVPKSLKGIGDSFTVAAAVNGNPISGKQLAIDPYSQENELTLHYLISKNDIINMAPKVPNGTTTMSFTLGPATGENAQTTTELFTETGAVKVGADWSPIPLSAGSESTLKLTFFNEYAGSKINDDVNYDLRILDSKGTLVLTKENQVAKGGTATQSIDFPSNANYRVEVQIKGIAKEGQPADQTMNGVARGIVVVPEFPAGALIATAGIVGAAIMAQRFARKMPDLQ